jgi:hypothetical protein
MNTKYISVYPQWHCRNGGGLFVGIRFQFPVTNYDSEAFASNHTYSCLRLTLGLLVFSINVELKYNYKDIPWPKPLDPPTTTDEAEARQRRFEDNIRYIQG